MKTLDQLGAEILAAIDSIMGDGDDMYSDPSVYIHGVPESLFTDGKLHEASNGMAYYAQEHRPQAEIFPSVCFNSKMRRPTEAEREIFRERRTRTIPEFPTQEEYEASRNLDFPEAPEELPF